MIDEKGFFNGTSGASAILAGVALSVQGMAQAHLGFRFSPWQLRLLLSDPGNGTLSASPEKDRIGVMPDLKKIIDNVLMIGPQRIPLADVDGKLDTGKSSDGSPIPGSVRRLRSKGLDLLEFLVKVTSGPRVTRWEVVSRLPREAKVWLEMPPEIADLEGIWGDPWVKKRIVPKSIFIPVNPYGKSYFREIRTAASTEVTHKLRLVVYVPPVQHKGIFQIEVRQFSQILNQEGGPPWVGEETGRATWGLACEPGQISTWGRASTRRKGAAKAELLLDSPPPRNPNQA